MVAENSRNYGSAAFECFLPDTGFQMTDRFRSLGLAGSLLGCLLVLMGCGGDSDTPPTTPVSGSISYKGKAVTGGLVEFHPQGVEGNPGTSPLGPNGEFTLTTYEREDGAVIGPHIVTVQVFPQGGLPGQEVEDSPIPKKYESLDTSDLKVEVTEDGDNRFLLELKD